VVEGYNKDSLPVPRGHCGAGPAHAPQIPTFGRFRERWRACTFFPSPTLTLWYRSTCYISHTPVQLEKLVINHMIRESHKLTLNIATRKVLERHADLSDALLTPVVNHTVAFWECKSNAPTFSLKWCYF
jgi:hypothetical protein